MDKLELVTIYTAQGMLAAQVVKGKLESAGIPALLRYESLGQIYGLTVDGLGQVRVQVSAHLAEEALSLLQEEDVSLEPENGPGDDSSDES
jgi:hypothetical protein